MDHLQNQVLWYNYENIKNYGPENNSKIPKKKTQKHPLTKSEKANNHKISSERVQDEHAIAFIKRFRILSENIEIAEKALHLDSI